MKLRRTIRDLLIMTKAERNGAMVLLFLIVLVIIIRLILPGYLNNEESYLKEIEQKIASIEKEKEQVVDSIEPERSSLNEVVATKIQKQAIASVKIPLKLFKFDPNSVTFNELVQLGFDKKIANTLINYREKGGAFRDKNDLLKIYGLDTTFFNRIRNYILIVDDSAISYPEIKSVPIDRAKTLSVEINSADSAMWTTLPGIGPVFAKRICRFRDYLGGFVRVDQLKEVYHLPPETYETIKDYLIIDTTLVHYININFADVDELKKHPYCNYEQAKKLIGYRSVNGNVIAVRQLLQDSVLNEEDFNRLSPYLSVR